MLQGPAGSIMRLSLLTKLPICVGKKSGTLKLTKGIRTDLGQKSTSDCVAVAGSGREASRQRPRSERKIFHV